MKRTLLACCFTFGLTLGLTLGSTAQAQTPKEVLEPYKAFRTALEQNDEKLAAEKAYEAWQVAEKMMGDSKVTGDLAQNYAGLNWKDIKAKEKIKAMARAMELSSFYGEEEASDMHMQRGVDLMELYVSGQHYSKARKLSDDLTDYAKANSQDRSVFYAEVLTLEAAARVRSRDGDKMVELTTEALDVFESPDAIVPSAYPIFANLYQGFGHEYNEDVLEAALSYQKVMDYVGKLDYGTHPIVGRALGRWTHMRGRLQEAGDLDEARENGLCDCWPYDVERNESIQPVKRRAPTFSSKATRSVSGYSIVQFDLDDDGKTKNAEIIVSWPPDIYEDTSLRALKFWEYTPKAEGETEEDRSNILVTIRYSLNDRFGNPVY